ncbi:MAG: hypothetical protein HS117_06180 [Verrucomicrobiaceae bacterium]|nr:hypothetical protein [Verrucomicrobiaceae bacterium]
MPRPKKPADKSPKPEYITADDFIRLTQEAENAFHERQRRERIESLAQSHRSKVFWTFVFLIVVATAVQGSQIMGFRLDESSFRWLISVLILPVCLSLTDKHFVALLHRLQSP